MMSLNEKPWPKPAAPAGVGVGAQVERPPLLRVGEHVVGLGDLLELLLGLRARVDVGVQLAGQLAVGALDVLRAGVPGDARGPGSSRSTRCPWCHWSGRGRSVVRGRTRVTARGSGRRSGPRRAPTPSSWGSPSGSGRARRGRRRARSPSRTRWRRPRWTAARRTGSRARCARTTAVGGLARGAEQLEQHDVLLQRLEHRADGQREVGAEPGEVGGAGEHDPLLALLDEGVVERPHDGAHEVAVGRARTGRRGWPATRPPRPGAAPRRVALTSARTSAEGGLAVLRRQVVAWSR